MARAWRPSHLNQRARSGCFSAYGVSLRSALGGLPTRPAGTIRWLRCERSEPRNHPRRQSVSWLGPGGPRTSTSVWGAAACRRAGSRYGRPWGASLLDQRGRSRWLRCERSEPRNHPRRQARFRGSGLAALAPQPARRTAASRRAGSRYGRPRGASLLDQRGGPVVEVRAQRATKPPSRGRVGFVARAWRPSHLNQRRVAAACRACGVSLRSALGGLPTRPAGTIAVVEVRAERASKPPSPGVGFVARAWGGFRGSAQHGVGCRGRRVACRGLRRGCPSRGVCGGGC